MNSRYQIGLSLLLTFAVTSLCSARTFYVDGNAAQSSDSNPGTVKLPFKTIQHGADCSGPGDTVLIQSGEYHESISLNTSGTAQHPITLQAESRHGVTILPPNDHTYTLIGPKQATDGHLLSNYVTMRGIVFGHTKFAGWGAGTLSVGVGRGDRLEDCVISNNMGLGFGTSNAFNCNDVTLLRTIIEGGYTGGCGGGGDLDAIPLSNWSVINCIFRRNNPEGVDPGGYNGANKFLYDKNLVFDGVISYDNNGSGSWFDTGAVDFVVKNCTFFGNHAGYERDLDGRAIGADESDCGSGFFCEANQGPGLFENNVFYSNLGDGLQDNDSGSKGAITIKNNWFVDNHLRALQLRGMADMNADYDNVDRKTVSNIIGFTTIGANAKYGSWAGDDRSVSWSGGTPTPSAKGDHGYIWQNADVKLAPNAGWKLSAPADGSTRTLTLFVGENSCDTTVTTHMSDGSSPDVTVLRSSAVNPGGDIHQVAISYKSASPGQTVTVTYVKSGNGSERIDGSADLIAATLSDGGDAGEGVSVKCAQVTGPVDLSTLGSIDWLHPGRVSYGGDRLLGPAIVTGNVFKGNGQPWGTTLEQRVLATPAAMGTVFDSDIYDISPDNTSDWGWWKPTNGDGIGAKGLAEMHKKLNIELHGKAEPVQFRGPLIHVYTYPTEADALNPDPLKLQEVPSQTAEKLTIDGAIAKAHAKVGDIVTIPVFGHTSLSPGSCQVYDLQARYVRLALPSEAAQKDLIKHVTPYAIIQPTYITVRLTRLDAYNIEAKLSL